MESTLETIEPESRVVAPSIEGLGGDGPVLVVVPASRPERAGLIAALAAATERFRWVVLVYLGSRVLLLGVALGDALLRHHRLASELAHWDGAWYIGIASSGYPDHVMHTQSTLGFFPLYPLVVSAILHLHTPLGSVVLTSVLVSGVGGLVAAVLVGELARGWWGQQASRRAVALFCFFPGSVVFSMAYAEGLAIPLAAGCILALQRRRWLTAGVLAGLATAAEPEALVLIVVCAISAGLELRRRGWGDRAARRSLLAPLLSLSGISAFACYLWAQTGTPFATLIAQHDGWGEKTDPVALIHLTSWLIGEISFTHFNDPPIDLNHLVGVVGAIVLGGSLILLFKARREISVEAITWTLGISLLALTSEYTPPNPRLLITAFPAVLVLARNIKGRAFGWLLGVNVGLLMGMSALTFVWITLRP